MQLVASRPQQQVLTLRRHPLVLLPRLALLISLWVVVTAGVLWHNLGLFGRRRGSCAGAGGHQVTSWWMYTITIRYDRVKVRRLRLAFVRDTHLRPAGVARRPTSSMFSSRTPAC